MAATAAQYNLCCVFFFVPPVSALSALVGMHVQCMPLQMVLKAAGDFSL